MVVRRPYDPVVQLNSMLAGFDHPATMPKSDLLEDLPVAGSDDEETGAGEDASAWLPASDTVADSNTHPRLPPRPDPPCSRSSPPGSPRGGTGNAVAV